MSRPKICIFCCQGWAAQKLYFSSFVWSQEPKFMYVDVSPHILHLLCKHVLGWWHLFTVFITFYFVGLYNEMIYARCTFYHKHVEQKTQKDQNIFNVFWLFHHVIGYIYHLKSQRPTFIGKCPTSDPVPNPIPDHIPDPIPNPFPDPQFQLQINSMPLCLPMFFVLGLWYFFACISIWKI